MIFSHPFRGLLFAALLFGVAVSPVAAQTGRITGTAVDENGAPLAGVAILAEAPDRPTLEGTTDESGRFSMVGFSTGQWTVTASLEGYQQDLGTVTVSMSTPGRAEFELTRVRSGFELFVGDAALEGLDADQLERDLEAADAAFETEDFDTAIAGYNELLTILPTLTFLQLNIGNAYRGKGDNEMALEAYGKIVDDPDHGEQAGIEIARTRLAMGDLDAVAGLAPAGADASREDLYNLGEVDFAKGDVDSAAGWYEKAAAVAPDWEKPWFKLALVALNKGDIETAKVHFQKVLEVAPNSEEGTQAQATLTALP